MPIRPISLPVAPKRPIFLASAASLAVALLPFGGCTSTQARAPADEGGDGGPASGGSGGKAAGGKSGAGGKPAAGGKGGTSAEGGQGAGGTGGDAAGGSSPVDA